MIGQKLKTARPTGGHVFQQIGTTFELNQDSIKTNILTNFELGRDFIGTKLLTKFHGDWTRNQEIWPLECLGANVNGRTDRQRPVTKAHLSNQKINRGHLANRASALPTELTRPPHNFCPNVSKFRP
ncbi:hypothetical protein DPMN_071348 [Dreissena polymorpha]|uniref:Uncharacterized protein n=1 Tax=Dreissena polymorpha TaxID=45954 RepID=A0A9D4BPK1_DREPO|nr:hypothetical protein DPMN_071348 [Dreissena polymorpha]